MEIESPECPVCLQNYDGDTVIPRVLACGHTACEACLLNLPQRYSHTIRCPECNQLVNYPSQGPTALPKNIDLLRLTGNSHKPDKTPPNYDPCHSQSHHFLPHFWSHEFFSVWKQWVLPNDAVLIEGEGEEAEMIRVGFYENQRVSVLRLVSLHDDDDDDSSVFRYSYVVKVMNCLSGMREEEREELGLILRAQKKFVCEVFGLWGDLEGGFLSLVCERQNGSLLEKFGDLGDRFFGEDEEGLSKDGISGFAMIGAGICEAVITLHFEGLVIGCLDLSCFSFDDFGRVCVDLSAVLVAGRKLRKHVVEAVSGKLRIDDNEMGVIFSGLLKNEALLSPQLLLELLQKEGIAVECGSSRCSVDCSSDVWSLACVLMRLLIGKTFTEETLEICEEKGSDYSTLYTGWAEKVRSLLETNLGSEYASLNQILCKCLNFDQGSRPLATDVWRCIRELLIKPKFDITGGFKREIKENNLYHCLIFGKLCQLPIESAEKQGEDGGTDFDQVDKRVDKSFVEGLSEGVIKCKDLQGHLDCITELAVGGGFLFSSSFDKTVQVWSLQDFSHAHTFRGHEHRVTALVYVDEEQLCISGDNSGGIFVWAIRVPFGQDPIKKWYEEKDWRYSGIHALTISGNGYLYTGSGDKSIKAWSLKIFFPGWGTLLHNEWT
ncbi:uncharacterized protein LOC126701260 isoform X2 [Quercus robur]|uniref:uncharacterized protein LOC126701260 isoform X2 n=1 Tax=Quercus robur TaxID=38942 RepID=UPI00216376BA|nr:uncharacterized protein LOC126701260 isoform X2 [Quercus robur]